MASKIKYGIKLWSKEEEKFKEANNLIKKGIFDYIELFSVPGYEIKGSLLPINVKVVHAPHIHFGFNIADKTKREFNLKCVKETIELANKVRAKYIIIHAGEFLDKDSEQTAKNFLKEINDKRIIVENMPYFSINKGEVCIGYNLKKIRKIFNKGICLDFTHAFKAAYALNKNPIQLIEELMDAKPEIFHLCGIKKDTFIDEHFLIKESNVNLKKFKKFVVGKSVTLEVPRKKLTDVIKDLKEIKKLWEN